MKHHFSYLLHRYAIIVYHSLTVDELCCPEFVEVIIGAAGFPAAVVWAVYWE